MRIRITSPDSPGLPLIGALPSWPLTRMEGYNGIGKSLTVRLLQLCAGDQPYHGPRAWNGLRAGLGKREVTIDELADDVSILWRLEPSRWPDTSEEVDDAWDGFDVFVNGDPACLRDVAEILAVHRLPGDVGLAETLGERVDSDRRAFRLWFEPLVDYERSPLRAAEDVLALAHDIVRRVDGDVVRRENAGAQTANREFEAARRKLADENARQQALFDALQLRDRVNELRGAGQVAAERLVAIDSELTSLSDPRAQLAAEIEELEQQAAQSEGAAKDLKNARRRLERHQGPISGLLNRLAQLVEVAGVSYADQAEADESEAAAAVASALATVRQDLDALVERRASIDAAPLLRSLLDDIAERLARAEADGLGRQPLLDSGEGAPLTVSSLRAHIDLRREALTTERPSEQGQALAARIDAAVEQIHALEAIEDVRSEIVRRRRLAAAAERDIQELVANANTTAAQRLGELVLRHDELESRAQALAFERTAMVKRQHTAAGGEDVSAIERRLDEQSAALSSTPASLADDLQLQAATARDTQRDFREAEARAEAAAASAGEHAAALRRVVAMLNDAEELRWLRDAQPTLTPRLSDPPERQLVCLARLEHVLSLADGRAGAARTQMLAVDQGLARLAGRLTGRQEVGGDAYLRELTDGYGAEFADWFDEPHVRMELFKGARRVSSVDLERDRLEVIWEDQSGIEHARPLEAFSRGEQAFAYTRARLASLDAERPRARNRLIVLDEFGAFIARDRLSTLSDMLAQRREREPFDQHLLILPVSTDYAELAASAPSSERTRLEQIVDDLKNHGFFVERL